MKLNRYKITLNYKGTNFNGWQKQPLKRTVQGVIEECLTKLNSNNKIEVQGCGRTDTGVHAKNYIAHFDFEFIDNIVKFIFKINNLLPIDISVVKIEKVENSFHSRYDAKLRTYHYYIHNIKNPFIDDFSFCYPNKIDVNKLNEFCDILIKSEDFECFSKVKTQVNNFKCSIKNAYWKKTKEGYLFIISSNRFLRNMVRSIVGTMLMVNENKISKEEFLEIIRSKNRKNAGKSVKSNGLFLIKLEY